MVLPSIAINHHQAIQIGLSVVELVQILGQSLIMDIDLTGFSANKDMRFSIC